MTDDLMTRIKKNEGYSGKPYRCTAGKLTIGYGRNLEDNGITESEASFLLSEDLRRSVSECIRAFTWFGKLNKARQGVIVEMCFNLGLPRLKTFKRMLAAMSASDYEIAASQMLDSLWAKQVGDRADALAEIMRNGKE